MSERDRFGAFRVIEHAGAARYAASKQRRAKLSRDRFEAASGRGMTAERYQALPKRERPMGARRVVVAIDHRIVRGVGLGAPSLIEQREQKAEPVGVDRTGRRVVQGCSRAGEIMHDENRRRGVRR